MKRFAAIAAAGVALAALSAAQSTTINGGRVIRGVWDASASSATKPARTGTVLPASCETGEAFFKTDAPPGANLYLCTAAGVWSEIGGGTISGAGQLRDFAVTQTSETVLSVTYTGAVRFGSETCSAPAVPTTVTLGGGAAGTGTVYFYMLPDCALYAGHNLTDAQVTCANCIEAAATTAYPANAMPLYRWTATEALGVTTWDEGGGTDDRAFLSTKEIKAAALGGIALTENADGSTSIAVDTDVVTSTFGITIDGGGSAITTGVKGYAVIPYACTIASWSLVADQSGSVVIDIWKRPGADDAVPTVVNTITASAKPTLSTDQVVVNNTTLTGWTISVAANDVVGYNVDSATTVQRVTLTVKCTR